jgi:hypothetical protein
VRCAWLAACVVAARAASAAAVAAGGRLRPHVAVPVPVMAEGLADWHPLRPPHPPLAALPCAGLVRLDAAGDPRPELATGSALADGGRACPGRSAA